MTKPTNGIFDPGQFPPPPAASISPTKNGQGLPAAAGIYFVWTDDSIVYCGLSKQLNKRATLSHRNIREGDMLSFLEFPDEDLVRVEAFYIGIIYPKRNLMPRRFPWWLLGG